MLEISNIHTFYGGAHILHGVSLRVEAGEVVSLLGRNGAGKTTTIKSAIGLVRPRDGRITFDGTETTSWASHRICHLGLGYVPEERRIFSGPGRHPHLDDRHPVRAVSQPGGTLLQPGWPLVRRRTADADHRTDPHGQPETDLAR